MQESRDIVVVGGGIMGLSTAYHLAARRAGSVLLLEKSFPGAGASGKSGAIIRQHYSNEITARMAYESRIVFEEFDERIGGDAGFEKRGMFFLVRGEDREGLEANVAMQRSLGIRTTLLSREEAQALEPRFEFPKGLAVCYEEDAGTVDPVRAVHAFASRARDLGVEIRAGAAVTEIRIENGRATGVATREGEIACREVVVCAGPWTRALLRSTGHDLPITPHRVQVATVRRPEEFGGPHPVCADFPNRIYFRPLAGDLTLIGSVDVWEREPVEDPDSFSEGVDDAFVKDTVARVRERIPAFRNAVVRGGWAGLYDISPDWHPLLGPLPGLEGILVAVGFSGHGFKLSPVVGRSLAEWVLDGKPSEDLSLFRASRFGEGEVVRGRYEYSLIG